MNLRGWKGSAVTDSSTPVCLSLVVFLRVSACRMRGDSLVNSHQTAVHRLVACILHGIPALWRLLRRMALGFHGTIQGGNQLQLQSHELFCHLGSSLVPAYPESTHHHLDSLGRPMTGRVCTGVAAMVSVVSVWSPGRSGPPSASPTASPPP